MKKFELYELLPLNPRTFYVLLALAGEERHGYAISKTIEAETGGMIRLTPGTLYPLIRQMLDDGWIVEIDGDGGDPRRRSYRLTAYGRRVAQAEAQRLEGLVRTARTRKLLSAVSVP